MSDGDAALGEIAPLLKGKEEEEAFRLVTQQSLRTLTTSALGCSPDQEANESVLSGIIQSNQLLNIKPIELHKWLYDSGGKETRSLEYAEIDQKVLKAVASASPGLVNRAVSLQDADPNQRQGPLTRVGRVCRIEAVGPDETSERGTGIFVTDTLVMTCWHVIDQSQVDHGEIFVSVPHFNGPNKFLGGVQAWSGIEYSAIKVLNKPHLLASSKAMPEQYERGSWDSVPSATEKGLDYAIFEIDTKTEKWTISVTADASTMNYVNANFVFSVFPTEFSKILRPTTMYGADDLRGKTVVAHTLSDRLKLVPRNGGSVKDANPVLNRIRYGEGDNGIKGGDSGSPVTLTDNDQLIALHNAATGDRSQAIPIGAIYQDVGLKNNDLLKLILPDFR